jgi:AraC-like DNA-binding protein
MDAPTILDTLRPESLFLNLNGRPFRQSQDDRWSIQDVVYRDYDLFVCYGGEAEFTIADLACGDMARHTLKEGCALLCPPQALVNARKKSKDNFRAIAQHFELKIIGTADFFDLIDYRPYVELSEWTSLSQDYERFVDLGEQPKSALIRNGLFLSILFSFLRDAYIGEHPDIHERFRFVFDMAGTLERYMTADDAVERSMQDIPYSKDYAVRMFRRRFGLPPKEFLLRCRMNAARDYLLAGLSVKETASRSGFADEQYFSRFFAKREGVSPREYRRRNGGRG